MARHLHPLILSTILTGCTAGAAMDSAGCTDADRTVDWENFGVGFFSGYCRGCHSAGVDNRFGAPPGVDFDRLDQVRTHAAAIHASVLEQASMPVGGGVDPEALVLLETFLECGL